MYLIQRKEPLGNGHRALVAIPGSKKSYTSSIRNAQKFDTYDEALDECCGNEYPVELNSFE